MPAFSLRRLSRGAAVVAVSAGLVVSGVSVGTTPTVAHASVSPTPAATAIRFALNQLGKPYRWGATGPYAYDCSGLTQAAYRAAGISIPRVAADQYRALPKIGKPYWRPGDLIFFAYDTSRPSTIHHVAIYLGHGWMLDAPHSGTVVQIQRIHSGLMWKAARPGGRYAKALLRVTPTTHGSAVRDLQIRLRANGYGIDVTGVYDTPTARAVNAARNRFDIADHHSVGWQLWRALVVHGAHRHAS